MSAVRTPEVGASIQLVNRLRRRGGDGAVGVRVRYMPGAWAATAADGPRMLGHRGPVGSVLRACTATRRERRFAYPSLPASAPKQSRPARGGGTVAASACERFVRSPVGAVAQRSPPVGSVRTLLGSPLADALAGWGPAEQMCRRGARGPRARLSVRRAWAWVRARGRRSTGRRARSDNASRRGSAGRTPLRRLGAVVRDHGRVGALPCCGYLGPFSEPGCITALGDGAPSPRGGRVWRIVRRAAWKCSPRALDPSHVRCGRS